MFYERLKLSCQKQNTTVTNMLKDLELSTGSTGNWKKGQLPKGDILAKIADYLHTSIDYLVFGEYRSDLREDERKIIDMFRSVPDMAKYKVLCDFETIVQSEIKKIENKSDNIE